MGNSGTWTKDTSKKLIRNWRIIWMMHHRKRKTSNLRQMEHPRQSKTLMKTCWMNWTGSLTSRSISRWQPVERERLEISLKRKRMNFKLKPKLHPKKKISNKKLIRWSCKRWSRNKLSWPSTSWEVIWKRRLSLSSKGSCTRSGHQLSIWIHLINIGWIPPYLTTITKMSLTTWYKSKSSRRLILS